MIGSPEVNKILRKHLSPTLRAHGFKKVSARKAWAWHDHRVFVFLVRSVGHYFSQVTGWPPMSLTVSLGVFFDFIPVRRPIKKDRGGRLLPEDYQCEMVFRAQLLRSIDQSVLAGTLSNPAERIRKDIWWLQPDGSNAEEVVLDIVHSFKDQAIPWFDRLDDIEIAFADIEKDKDCYAKFRAAKWFAEHLGLQDKREHYLTLLRAEEQRLQAKGFLS